MSSKKIPVWVPELSSSILQTVKIKDEYTFTHCCRVGRAARQLGKVMGLDEFELAVLEYSGLFHDVGKVGIPDEILLKPGRLSSNEVDVMKNHAELSVEVLKPLMSTPFIRFLIPGVRFHHERVDGIGYPFGLKGERIPITARIISVVDTVDAMTNSRPYRNALPMEAAKEELVRCSGAQFDANIVQVYLKNIDIFMNIHEGSETEKEELIVAELLKPAA